jgi:hypothetical protein
VTGPLPPEPRPPQGPQSVTRPVDVETGFWLWLVAIPLMVIGYVADTVASSPGHGAALLYIATGVFTGLVCAVTVTFLILMRAGYRWARTLLTGGGIATVVYVGTRLFTVNWPPVVAVICGVTGITGSVLIAGGMFLLHRNDSHAFFTR